MNAAQPLDAALHLRLNPRFFQFVLDDPLHLRQESFTLLAPRVDGFLDLLITGWVKKEESKIFEFAANLSHAQPVRDGSVDLKRLFGDLALALGRKVFERAHVVQAI